MKQYAVIAAALAFASVAPALAGCARATYDYAHEPDPRKQEFAIGPGDVLRVDVWRNPDMSGEVTVRPDGTLTLPLLGDLQAGGRTSAVLCEEIRGKLAKFFKDEEATVTVAVKVVNSYRFTVSGNVEHGGLFNASQYVTVAEAVALAGGPNRFASPSNAVLIRTRGAETRRIPIDYEAIQSGQRPEQNLVLLPGDSIYIP